MNRTTKRSGGKSIHHIGKGIHGGRTRGRGRGGERIILTRGQVVEKSARAAAEATRREEQWELANPQQALPSGAGGEPGELDDGPDPWVDEIDMDDVYAAVRDEQETEARDQIADTCFRKDARDRGDRVQKVVNGFRRLRESMTTPHLDWRADPNTCDSPWAQVWTPPEDSEDPLKVHVVDIFGEL
uniref:Uncharacterized protein n=1 Tax=Mycena chlorophos TaxID=658473 RepID=A0ABQ0LPS0_MYCCL|nr:predicted protein [Mycena chlorophos]